MEDSNQNWENKRVLIVKDERIIANAFEEDLIRAWWKEENIKIVMTLEELQSEMKNILDPDYYTLMLRDGKLPDTIPSTQRSLEDTSSLLASVLLHNPGVPVVSISWLREQSQKFGINHVSAWERYEWSLRPKEEYFQTTIEKLKDWTLKSERDIQKGTREALLKAFNTPKSEEKKLVEPSEKPWFLGRLFRSK